MIQEWKCCECDASLFYEQGTERKPCPHCGSERRCADELLREEIAFYDELRMKGKHEGRGKPFFEARVGPSFFFKDGVWNHVEQIVDRENNRYIKIIRKLGTGEVIRHDDKPLDEHTEHGSAKQHR
ncbi:MAG: hypothetical protein K9N21_10035 [Deltaproteobacteria bacterium]|nr:hypothetical protein [Deltaproteobacteria bacterium]